jgi:hypothetical protein
VCSSATRSFCRTTPSGHDAPARAGGCYGDERSAVRRQLTLIATAGALAVALAGCDGGADDSIPESIVANVEARVISGREVARTRPGSPERAFLRFWSSLQYASWLHAVSFFRPALVDAIGAARLIGTLSAHKEYFRLVKPAVRGHVTVSGDYAVRYLVPAVAGREPIPLSITWRRGDGRWQIHHMPQLDDMLRSFEQVRVQTEVDPLAATPSRRALRAAAAAAGLQARYLATQGRRRPR